MNNSDQSHNSPAGNALSDETQNEAAPIIALLAAYNEGDVISHVVGDLIANGILVYLIDNSSTDDTVEQASKWIGKGLIKIESFPEESGYSERCGKEYVWRQILARKEELATQLVGSWFLHTDADEFRESPWTGKSLAEAIRHVDELGYNAINFELFNFRPTDDNFRHGADVREHLTHYQPGELFDSVQIKAWKNTGPRVALASNAGHSVDFPNRKVFPLNFILRHYPIRGETHGRRKVFTDRLPRFAKEEVTAHWHVQYNEFLDGKAKFLHNSDTLMPWDGNKIRAALLAKFTQDFLTVQAICGSVLVPERVGISSLCKLAAQKLGMSVPLSVEIWQKTDAALQILLSTQEDGFRDLDHDIDLPLCRLLLVMIDIRLSFMRLTGNSRLAYLANLLTKALKRRVSGEYVPRISAPPMAETAERFNVAMREARAFAQVGQYNEALAQMEIALRVAPTAEGVTRAKEIQQMLQNAMQAA